MNATDVECPICGALNEELDLDETDGWMECEESPLYLVKYQLSK